MSEPVDNNGRGLPKPLPEQNKDAELQTQRAAMGHGPLDGQKSPMSKDSY